MRYCLVFALVLTLFMSSAWAAGPLSTPIVLKDIPVKSFAAPPAPLPQAFPAKLQDNKFPLSAASNFAAVEKRLGGLTEAQKQYLEEHRFLLLPPRSFLDNFPDGSSMFIYDEMLHEFDNIGGPSIDEPMERAPEHAVLIGPDVFLQALHTYFSQRLKTLEKTELSHGLQVLLQNLYANSRELGSMANEEAQIHWQRLQTQLIIPLVLLKNCAEPEHLNPWEFNEQDMAEAEDNSDTLEQALEIFASYAPNFNPTQQQAIQQELERIYSADSSFDSLVGLKPAYPAPSIDYTQFKARGHYENASLTRAYFRAMIWLGQMGWNLTDAQGLADSINFALAMSYDGGQHKNNLDELSFRQHWQRIMEISSFFVGYADVPAYPEWQAFLTQNSDSNYNQNSCVDSKLLQKLADNLDNLSFPQIPFETLQDKEGTSVLTIFPQRLTIPWLIADRLTFKREIREDVPIIFSSLWIPALLGSNYAQGLLPEQIKVCLEGKANADLQGAPRAWPKSEAITDTRGLSYGPEDINFFLSGLTKHMRSLSTELQAQKPEDWYSSIGAVWFSLLSTLTAEYGPGYPLYMQDLAFPAKQLETLMGAYTALKHDTILYEKPNYAELGAGWYEGEIPPVPKGFVEPNLPFWHALLHAVDYMAQGFATFGIFASDLEEYGALTEFRQSLELCIRLSEKELANIPLTEDEYESIRTLELQYMAALQNNEEITLEEALSAIVVDIQTANLDDQMGAEPVIVYVANAAPYIMLALVGNEDSPRVVTGMAFNHHEFYTPHGSRLTDSMWKKRVYGEEDPETSSFSPERSLSLPEKNFWYDVLQP